MSKRQDTDCIGEPIDIKSIKLKNKPWTEEEAQKAMEANMMKSSNKDNKKKER